MGARRNARVLVMAACAAALLAAAPADARMAPPKIKVVSNRADLVSGGDAYVRVTLPRRVKASRLRLTAGRRNVTEVLHKSGARQLDGVVTGLPNGRVALKAR